MLHSSPLPAVSTGETAVLDILLSPSTDIPDALWMASVEIRHNPDLNELDRLLCVQALAFVRGKLEATKRK